MDSETDDLLVGDLGGRIRQLRSDRKWSLETLSNASGVSRSMLSQIERNEANPTLAVTMRIARALGITVGDLVESPGAISRISVIRTNDPAQIYKSDRLCEIRTLSPLQLEKDVEIYQLQLQPEGELRSSPHFEGTREFLFVEKGKVRVESAADCEGLEKGDSASYRADVPHAIVNAGKGEAICFLVVIYR